MIYRDKFAPDNAPLLERRNPARKAWIWLGTYALIRICFYVYFEWRNALYGSVSEYLFFDGVFFLFYLASSLVLFIRSLLKRMAKAAIINAALFLVSLGTLRLGTAIDLTAKA